MFSLTSIFLTTVFGCATWVYFQCRKPQQSEKIAQAYVHPKDFLHQYGSTQFSTIPDYLNHIWLSFGSNQAVGSRTDLGKDKTNPKLSVKSEYQWKHYADLYKEIISFQYGLFNDSAQLSVGDRVCIFADTQERWLTSALAVMRGGGIVTTAYATLGVDALIFSLNQTQSKVIITQSNLYASVIEKVLPQTPSVQRVIFLDLNNSAVEIIHPTVRITTYDAVKNTEPGANWGQVPEVDTTQTALIMYTSGTTGNPKGIEVTHGQICQAIKSMTSTLPEDYNIAATDRVFAYLPLAHILEMIMELSVLSRGGCIAYGDLRTMTDDSCVNTEGKPCGDLSLARPTLFAGVPKVYTRTYDAIKTQIAKQSAMKQKVFAVAFWIQKQLMTHFYYRSGLIDRYIFKPIQKKFGGQVRLFLSGGSALSGDVQIFMSVVAGPVIQGYGLTETCCTGTLQHPHNCFDSNVGGPVRGNLIQLRDCPDLGYTEQDPLGPSGEILIAGRAISKGYYLELAKHLWRIAMVRLGSQREILVA